MIDVGHVYADLVGAAGFQIEAYQGVGREAAFHPVAGGGGPARVADRHAGALYAVSAHGRIDSATGAQNAGHNGEIFPFHLAVLECSHQVFMGQ